jgi:hypothetical protein
VWQRTERSGDVSPSLSPVRDPKSPAEHSGAPILTQLNKKTASAENCSKDQVWNQRNDDETRDCHATAESVRGFERRLVSEAGLYVDQ